MQHLPTPQTLGQLHDVLLASFDHAALSRLVRFHLGEELEWFTPVQGQRDLSTVVDHVVAYYASRAGGLHRLLDAALEANPSNEQLQLLHQQWNQIEFAPLPLPQNHPSIRIDTVIQGPLTFARTYVQRPATFYSDISRFARNHPLISVLFILVQALLGYAYWLLKDTYILAVNLYLTLALCLALALVGIYVGRSLRAYETTRAHRAGWLWKSIGVTSAAVWLVIMGVQIYAIRNPVPFAEDQFGIAVATFSQSNGGSWGQFVRAAPDGYEIADRIQQQLNEAIVGSDAYMNTVATRRIGTLRNVAEAPLQVNKELGAKLVIWGQLVRNGETIDVNLEVIQALDFVENPAFPQPISVASPALTNYFSLPYAADDSFKEVIEEQTLGIAAFAMGLVDYYSNHPDHAISRFETALNRFDSAERLSAGLDSVTKNKRLIYFYLGRSYQVLGQYEESIAALDQALQQAENDVAALQVQLYNYRAVQAKEDAIHHLSTQHAQQNWKTRNGKQPWESEWQARRETVYHQILHHSQRDEPAIRYNRARAHYLMGNIDKALNEYEAMIKDYPDYFVAYLGAAGIIREQRRFDSARKLLDRAAELTADEPTRQLWYRFALARLIDEQGQVNRLPEEGQMAVNAYLAALELDRNKSIAQLPYRLALAYGRMGDDAQARNYFEALTRRTYLGHWAHGAYGRYLLSIGETAEAISRFQMALLEPAFDKSMANAYLGMAYTQTGDEQKAIEAFEAALNPPGEGLAFVLHEYGRTLYRFGHLDAAIDRMDQSLRVNGGFAPETMWNLASYYEQRNDMEADSLNPAVKLAAGHVTSPFVAGDLSSSTETSSDFSGAHLHESTAFGIIAVPSNESDIEKAANLHTALIDNCDKLNPQLLYLVIQRAQERALDIASCSRVPRG